MKKTEKSVKSKQTSGPGSWYMKAAFVVGKTAKKVSESMGNTAEIVGVKLDYAKTAFNEGFNRGADEAEIATTKRTHDLPDTPGAEISPILREVKGIMDVSGLSEAIREMNEIGLEHSKHPVISCLISKIEGLPPADQEILATKFIDRLSANAYFHNATRSLPLQVNFSEEDCQKGESLFTPGCFQASYHFIPPFIL